MKSHWMIDLVGLAIGLVALAHSGRSVLQLRAGLASAHFPAVAVSVGMPFSCAGVDAQGRVFVPNVPKLTQRIVAFVLRSSTYSVDLAYWDSIRERMRGNDGLILVAFCNDRFCAEAAKGAEPASFPIIAFGQVQSLERLGAADKEGAALVLNFAGNVKEILPWRGVAAASTFDHLMEAQ